MPPDRRDGLRRWAAPVALLALVTVAVVLIHNGLSSDDSPAPQPPTATQTTARTTTERKPPKRQSRTSTAGAEYYVVQSGDTFGAIASRYGMTVDEIEALNPGVSSNSLVVGQKIRVK